LTFFQGLEQHNRREWFQPRKQIFEENVKAPMVELVETLNAELLGFAPDYVTEPERAIYRIYRDTRFSRDKTPYKTHIAASFYRRGLEKHQGAGFYFSVSHREIEVGGGAYMPPPESLLAIRGHLAEHHEEFERIVKTRGLRTLVSELLGDRLARVPKGFPSDHPAAHLLRHKQWYVYAVLDAGPVTTHSLLPELVRRFRAMAPLVDFLNTPLVAAGRQARRQALMLREA